MKRELIPARRWSFYLYRIMVLLLLLLALVLIFGTIFGLVRFHNGAPLFKIGGFPANSSAPDSPAGNGVFTGIGRLRIPLGASVPGNGTLILSIAFPYPNDQAFTEELALKIGDFRAAATAYFSSLPSEKLVNLDEEAAKTELLKRYNAGLRLGKIQTLYFSDLMIIER